MKKAIENNKAYFTLFDGEDKAGFGSIVQAQLILVAYCKLKKASFFFPGFKNLNHWQLEKNKSQIEFSNQLNMFLPIGVDSKKHSKSFFYKIDYNYLINCWLEFNCGRIVNILKDIELNYETPYFEKSKINVVIHYRNHLKTDTDTFDRGIGDNSYYEHAIKIALSKYSLSDINFILFANRNCDFIEYLNKKYSVKSYLETSLSVTYSHFVLAEVLITSKSSLSWSAHLYGRNKLVVGRHFWHPWYKNTILINSKGKIKLFSFYSFKIKIKSFFKLINFTITQKHINREVF